MAVFNDGVIETNIGADTGGALATFAITQKESLSPELVTADLTTGNGVTVTGNDATHTVTFSSAGMRYKSDTTSPILTVSFNGSIIALGGLYKVTATATGSGSLKSDQLGGSTNPISSGTTTFYVVATAGTLNLYRNGTNVDLTISSLSVQLVTAADYTDGNKNLLVQESTRPNLLKSPNDFTDPAWYQSSTPPTIATWTKDTVTFIGDGVHNCYIAQQMKGLQGGLTYIFKVVARSNIAGQRMYWPIQGNGTGFSSSGFTGTLDVVDKVFTTTVFLPADGNYLTFSIGQITNYNAFTGNEMILTVTDVSVTPALSEQSNFIGNLVSDGVSEPLLSSELVVNGGFDVDANWTKAGSVYPTISGGMLNFSGSNSSYVYQNILTAGALYYITYTVTSVVSGYVKVGSSGGTYSPQRTTPGTYTDVLISASTALVIYGSTGSFNGSVDNVSVKLVKSASDSLSGVAAQTATPNPLPVPLTRGSIATNPDGSYVSGNLPRFDTGPRAGSTALLLEEGTTNLVVTDFSEWGAYTTGGATGTVEFRDDPVYGKVVKLTKTDSGSGRFGLFGRCSGFSGQVYSRSIWIRPLSTTGGVAPGYVDARSTPTPLMTISVMKPLSNYPLNTWTKVTDTKSSTTDTLTGSANMYIWVDTAAGSCEFALPQLELKSFSSSFVNGTRNPETVTLDITNTLNAQNGTVEFWWNARQPSTTMVDQASSPRLMQLGTYYGNSSISLWAWANTGTEPSLRLLAKGQTGSTWSTNPSQYAKASGTGWYPYNTWAHFAISWQNGNLINIYFNGVLVQSAPLLGDALSSFAGNALVIGNTSQNAAKPNCGYADLRLSNVCRTSAEILANYQSGLPATWDAKTSALYPLAAPDTYGVDSTQVSAIKPAAASEPCMSSESELVSMVGTPAIAETSASVEATLGNYVTYSSATDTSNATDTEVAESLLNGATAELCYIADSLTSNMIAAPSLLESLAAVDSTLATASRIAGSAEALYASEAASTFIAAAVNLLEALTSRESEVSSVSAVASSSEQTAGADSYDNTANMVAGAKEKSALQSATYILEDILKRTVKDNAYRFGNTEYAIVLDERDPSPVFSYTEVKQADIKGE